MKEHFEHCEHTVPLSLLVGDSFSDKREREEKEVSGRSYREKAFCIFLKRVKKKEKKKNPLRIYMYRDIIEIQSAGIKVEEGGNTAAASPPVVLMGLPISLSSTRTRGLGNTQMEATVGALEPPSCSSPFFLPFFFWFFFVLLSPSDPVDQDLGRHDDAQLSENPFSPDVFFSRSLLAQNVSRPSASDASSNQHEHSRNQWPLDIRWSCNHNKIANRLCPYCRPSFSLLALSLYGHVLCAVCLYPHLQRIPYYIPAAHRRRSLFTSAARAAAAAAEEKEIDKTRESVKREKESNK